MLVARAQSDTTRSTLLLGALAACATMAAVVYVGLHHADRHHPTELPDGTASEIWDLAERATISRLN